MHSGLLIYVMGFSEMQKLEYWHWVRHEYNKMYVFIGRKEAERSKYLFFQRKAIFAFWVCRPKLQVHRNNFFYLMYQGGNKTKQRHKIKMKQSNIFMIQVYSLTQYMMGVHPSMVTHWKVVSMASMMLSKLVIP